MKCPKCNQEVTKDSYCSRCKMDINAYKKIKNISKQLYNKGLGQAKNKDLTGAAESLEKSIQFDKGNIQARNLLGLVYYEVGEMGLALKHWVISSHFKRENNDATTYINAIQENGRKLEKYSDSLKKYNQALQYIHQKSEDMAIIQLKKVVHLSPNFVEAYCLLALCYMIEGKQDKALENVEKALDIDVNHPKAIRYYKELKPDKVRPEVKEHHGPFIQPPEKKYSRAYHMEKKKANTFSPIGQIGLFVAGALCAIAVIYILVFPSMDANLNKQLETLRDTTQEQLKQKNRIIDEQKEIIAGLEEKNESLETTNNELEAKQAELNEFQKVNQASILNQNNKIQEAALILESVDESFLQPEGKTTYDALVQEIYPKAARILYDSGISQYWQKKYEQARNDFEKSRVYNKNDYFSDDALYFLGVIAETNDPEKAKQIYSQLLEQYPNSNQYYQARNRFNGLNTQ